MYKELWGRGVLRTIQEELLELIIVKYDVPFFYIFITCFQHFSAAVYILKKLTVFAFLQTKSLCILLKETQKGKKAASRWSGGEGGGGKPGKCWQELPFSCLPTANPSFCSSRELCEPVTPLAMAQSLAPPRDEEKMCGIESFILVYPSLCWWKA